MTGGLEPFGKESTNLPALQVPKKNRRPQRSNSRTGSGPADGTSISTDPASGPLAPGRRLLVYRPLHNDKQAVSMNFDDETLKVFLDEAREHLEGIESDLLFLEKTQEKVDKETVNKVFRAVHSVKGGAGFFGFEKIKDLTHAMESVFGLIRKSLLQPNSDLVSLLLESADRLKQMIHNPESMDSVAIDSQLAQLNGVLSDASPEASGASPQTVGACPESSESSPGTVSVCLPDGKAVFTVTEAQIEKAKKGDNGGANLYLLAFDLIKDIRDKAKTPQEVISETSELTALIESKIDGSVAASLDVLPEGQHDPLLVLVSTGMDAPMMEEFLGLDQSRIHLISRDVPTEADGAPSPLPRDRVDSDGSKLIAEQPAAEPAAQPKLSEPDVKADREGSIRVSVKVIDQLMVLAGELVLARNQLLQGVSSGCMTSIETISQRMDLVTTDLQDAIMATRMQSIGIVFGKFRRIVRDLARNLGKHVNLVLDGEEVELDKTIIEAISDPLIHLVRNALDHGIETPEERALAGKPAAGTLKLSALHKAGQVLIEIADDGAGIDPENVRRKAASLGLYTLAQLEEMSDNSLVQLIFRPGFSTAAEVSDLSGRGVGMDVVHSNLSRLSGAIDVETTKGKGTTVRITLPLTLAIIPALLVAAEGEQFAIPQHNLVELVRLPVHEAAKRIERIGDARVLRLRGELLPLVDLRSVLDRSTRSADSAGSAESNESADTELDAFYIAVVAAGEFQYGLIVEKLLDSAEIVVKPLGKHLRHCRVYAGATILGTGRVALILDILGISQEIRTSAQKAVESERDTLGRADADRDDDIQSLLVVGNGPGEQLAIPLGLVGRIERIHCSRIEKIGGRSVMKYRGGSLQLLDVESVIPVQPREETEYPYVIQFRTRDRDVGLVVARIVDITRVEGDLDRAVHSQRGVLGSLIVGDTITLVIDPQEIAAAVLYPADDKKTNSAPEFGAANAQEADRGGRNILVVEDSPFFLDQITSLVEEAGYCALPAKNGLEAIEILRSHTSGVDLVLTDIEMPELDGFGLAEQIRSDQRYGGIPIIAVTSLLDGESRAKGKAAGVDEYLVKLDKEQVLDRCAHYLNSNRPMGHTQPVAMGGA